MDKPSTDLPTTSHLQINEVPDTVVESLLGRGLSYLEWKSQLTRRRYLWNEGLKLRIIRKEFLMFKPEIERMLLEPNTGSELGPKSNSYIQIMKRIKGKTGDREERLASGTLFGSNGKAHTLERYVEKWRIEDPSYGYAADTTKLSEESDSVVEQDVSPTLKAQYHDLQCHPNQETHTSAESLYSQIPTTVPIETCETSDGPFVEPFNLSPNTKSNFNSKHRSKYRSKYRSVTAGASYTINQRRTRGRQFAVETKLRHQVGHLDSELRKSKIASKAKDDRIQELQMRLELLEMVAIRTRSEDSSPRSSNDMEDVVVGRDLREETVHQIFHETIIREARAAKRMSILQRPSSEIFPSEQEEDKSITPYQRRKFISSKSPVKLDLVASANRTSTISNRLSRSGDKSDTHRRRSSSMRRLVRQAGNALLRSKGHEETDEVPPLPPSIAMSKEEEENDPRDSGYGSFDFGATPRASVINTECERGLIECSTFT